MRIGIKVEVSATDRIQLEAIVADRNAPQKHVWRARIVLLTANGRGTAEIMRQADVSKTAVWRWQERFMTDRRWPAARQDPSVSHSAARSRCCGARRFRHPDRSAW